MEKLNTTVLRTVLFAVVATLALTTVYAGGGIKVKAVKNKSIMVVSIQELNQQSVKLSIEDQDEQTIYYTENIQDVNAIQKAFDVSALSDGDYVVIAQTGTEVLKEEITLLDSKVTVREFVEVEKPVFKLKGTELTVLFQNEASVSCSIQFTDANDVFFSDKISESLVTKKYNLSKLPIGEYTVSVNNGSQSFYYTLNID